MIRKPRTRPASTTSRSAPVPVDQAAVDALIRALTQLPPTHESAGHE